MKTPIEKIEAGKEIIKFFENEGFALEEAFDVLITLLYTNFLNLKSRKNVL